MKYNITLHSFHVSLLSFDLYFAQKNYEMASKLVVEGEESVPPSEVCSRTQKDAIEELQEEEEELE